jgi:hypothetical protein
MGKVAHYYQMSNRISGFAYLLDLNRHLFCLDIQKIIKYLGRAKYLCELLDRDKPDIPIGHLVELLGFAI